VEALRRLLYPLSLAGARLASRRERVLLVGLGVAAGAAVLAAVLAGSLVMRDRSLALATADLPLGDRTVQAAWFGATGTGEGDWASLDRTVRPALHRLNGSDPVSVMLFREAQIRGHLVDLRAVDGLARWVTLRSGRLPRPCTPSRCEVLEIAGKGPIPSVPDLRLSVVGHATLTRDAPFRSFIRRPATAAAAYHAPLLPPLVIAEGVRGLSVTPELSTFFRSYAWVLPIEPGNVHPWAVDDFARRVDRARSAITARSDRFDVSAPLEQLRAAAASSRASGRRLLLLGGEAATLLLAFTILAAASVRRDSEEAWRRLTWFGARRWQLVAFSGGESFAVAATATVVGWLAGAGVAAAIARRAGAPPGEVLRHSVLSGRGLAVAGATAVLAALLLFAALRAPVARLGGLAVSPADVAALGALVAIGVGLARGRADAQALASEPGTGAFLLLLPALIAFVGAIAAARLLAPLLRLLERAGRRGPVPLRLAALSLARNPGHATVAATFLVVSLGMALFAATYRATLARGQAEQAAFAVPADYVATEDLSKLRPVAEVVPARYPGLRVLRLSGDAGRLEGGGFTLLGIPAGSLERVRGWRGDFSSRSLPELGSAITTRGPIATRGIAVPAGTLRLAAAVHGDDVAVRAVVRKPDGEFAGVALGETHGPHAILRGRVPAGTLVALDLDLLNGGRRAANAGTGLQPSARGVLTLDGLDFSGWIGEDGAVARGGRVGYLLTSDSTTRFRARQPTDGHPIAAIVSPALAAAAGPDGLLPVDVEGEHVTVRVAGVTTRFPSVDGPVVLADRDAVSTALDAASPGLGVPNELWAEGPRPPFPSLQIESHAAVAERLRADPLARGALLTLAATAVAALLLALVGLVLGLVSDMRDESGELRDLETQGAAPATLRRQLRLRTLIVTAFGVFGGLATGAVLSLLVIDLVALTAGSAAPEPPLRLHEAWTVVGPAALVYVTLAGGLVASVTRRGA